MRPQGIRKEDMEVKSEKVSLEPLEEICHEHPALVMVCNIRGERIFLPHASP